MNDPITCEMVALTKSEYDELIAYYRAAAPQLAREVQRLTAERDDAREMTHAALDDIGAPGDRSVPPWERIGRIAALAAAREEDR